MAKGKKTNKGKTAASAASSTPDRPYAVGHGIVFDQDGERRALAEGITFVNGKRKGKGQEDGSAERPFSSIARAVEEAGENALIFVGEGLYREVFTLKPGQTLTSVIELAGHPAERRYATDKTPLIRPKSSDLIDTKYRGDDRDEPYSFAVGLPENTELRRLKIEVAEKDAAAVRIEPVATGADDGSRVVVADCELSTTGTWAHCVYAHVPEGGRMAELDLRGNRMKTWDNGAMGLFVDLESGARLAGLRIRANTVTVAGSLLHAVGVVIRQGANVGRLEARDNFILTGVGRERFISRLGNGISLSLHEAAGLDELELRDNDIMTGGENESCIFMSLHSTARAGSLRIHGNRMTVCRDGWGLHCTMGREELDDEEAEGAVSPAEPQVGLLCLEANAIGLVGDESCGMELRLTREAHVEALRVCANLIVDKGDDYGWAHAGIKVDLNGKARLNSLKLEGNVIDLAADHALGLHVRADEGNRPGILRLEENDLLVDSDEGGCVIALEGDLGLAEEAEKAESTLRATNAVEAKGDDCLSVIFDAPPEVPYEDEDEEYEEEEDSKDDDEN